VASATEPCLRDPINLESLDFSPGSIVKAAHDHPSLFRISISIVDDDDGFHIGELAKHQLRNLKHDLVKNY